MSAYGEYEDYTLVGAFEVAGEVAVFCERQDG